MHREGTKYLLINKWMMGGTKVCAIACADLLNAKATFDLMHIHTFIRQERDC